MLSYVRLSLFLVLMGLALPGWSTAAVTVDGDLSDWAATERLDLPPWQGINGNALYGTYEDATYYIAVTSPDLTAGSSITLWLNSDQDSSTGYQIWGFAGGIEYNAHFIIDSLGGLFTGGAGENPVAELNYAVGPDGIEVEIPEHLLDTPADGINLLVNINNTTYLPSDYSLYQYTISNEVFPSRTNPNKQIGIVYSETTATNFSDLFLYSQLFMAMQHQAMMAGIPFDILTEADLMNVGNIVNYDAIIMPYFANIPQENLNAVAETLHEAVYRYNIGLITAGDFLTNDELNNALPGNPYERLNELFGVGIVASGGPAAFTVETGNVDHPILSGYSPNEEILSYDANWYASFESLWDIPATVLAHQIVNGEILDGVIATQPGGRNVHFGNILLLGDSNLVWSALQWVVYGDHIPVGLKMGRNDSLFCSRVDMDQSAYIDEVVNVEGQLYNDLVNWKNDYNYVGSFYINIGHGALQKQTFTSIANEDGYIMEFTERSNRGSSVNSGSSYLRVGDEFFDRQIKSILSFDTSAIPETAIIKKVTLELTRERVVGTDPFTTHGNCNVLIKSGYFNSSSNLERSDFEAAADLANAAIITAQGGSGTRYIVELNPAAIPFINVGGRTQFRIEFQHTDNDDFFADYVQFYSANYSNAAFQPSLKVEYMERQIPGLDENMYTDWDISGPLYRDYIALGNEIGTHSYTHPDYTSELNATELEFEINQSAIEIGTQLGIEVQGLAVPGNPENLETNRIFDQWMPYVSGRYSSYGIGFPGAFGYLQPDFYMLYFSLNMWPDFTMLGFWGWDAQQAEQEWIDQFDRLNRHTALPIIHWMWHDYGPVGAESGYTKEMYSNTIAHAYSQHTEFITGNDLYQRFMSYMTSSVTVEHLSADRIQANVSSGDAGKFGLNVNTDRVIQSVENWYAYNDTTVFLPSSGGQYLINLGEQADDVTHITELPMRASLVSASGDGTDLQFTFEGEGAVVIRLSSQTNPTITGADRVEREGDIVTLFYDTFGTHQGSVAQ